MSQTVAFIMAEIRNGVSDVDAPSSYGKTDCTPCKWWL